MVGAVTDDDAFQLLAMALDPVTPPASTRGRLMAAIEGPARYLPFCAELCSHFDLPEAKMRDLLMRIDEPSTWKRGIDCSGIVELRTAEDSELPSDQWDFEVRGSVTFTRAEEPR